MVRVKGGIASQKRRRHLLKYTKGFRWRRKSTMRAARTAIMHAWEYSYRDRKTKKRVFRKLWELQINAACRKLGLTYSQFINKMEKNNVASLEELIKDAKELGVKVVACEMTMSLMNVPKDSLIPEVNEIGGVGTYLDNASKSNINLFI